MAAADYVFELMAKLGLDDSTFQGSLGKDGEQLESFGSKAGKTAKAIGKGVAVAATAVATATVAMGTAIVKSAGETAAYGDNIDKMSQKLGMSAEAYQEWDAVLQHSGTSIESMQAGMKTLATAAETGNAAFEKLGMTQEEIANMSQQELFEATITALQNVSSETERTYLAGQLLGRGATELGPLLNTSAEETQKMRDRVHELGGVMSDEAVKAAAHYQDSLQDMQTALSGLQRSLTGEFLPGITQVMDGLTEVFSGNSEGGLGMISEGIDNLLSTITEEMPRFIDLGLGIVESLLTAIIENLPKFADAAVKIILSLTQNIIGNLPKMVDAAVEIIFALADGLIEALPELIPAIVEVILTIVDKLTDPDMLMKLIDAAFQIIAAIAEGLIKALPKLIEKAPEIMMNLIQAILEFLPQLLESGVKMVAHIALGIVQAIPEAIKAIFSLLTKVKDAFFEKIEEAKEWGRDLIANFADGIKSALGGLWNVVKGVASGIKSFLGFSEPERGPLSNFHTYAPDMMKLFAQGIKDNEHLITGQIESSFNLQKLMPSANFEATGTGSSTTNNYITVNGIAELEEVLRWYQSRQVVERMA